MTSSKRAQRKIHRYASAWPARCPVTHETSCPVKGWCASGDLPVNEVPVPLPGGLSLRLCRQRGGPCRHHSVGAPAAAGRATPANAARRWCRAARSLRSPLRPGCARQPKKDCAARWSVSSLGLQPYTEVDAGTLRARDFTQFGQPPRGPRWFPGLAAVVIWSTPQLVSVEERCGRPRQMTRIAARPRRSAKWVA